MSNRQSRRTALKGAVAAAPWLLFSSSAAKGFVDDGDRINVGVIGIGMRGKYLIANLPESLRVTALCDCSLDQIDTARNPQGRFAESLHSFASGDGRRCRLYQDYRVMLRQQQQQQQQQQQFDAIIIAAPDHHHAGAAIMAMQAGADVYIEKPLAVTIAEGRAIVDAAKRYRRVVQVGSQQRTMEANRRACLFIRNGGLGRISHVEESNFPGPMPYLADSFPRQRTPSRLDWDLFCGPTPQRAYHKKLWTKDAFDVGFLLWRGWDLFNDYSGHLMTNWGAHSVDMIQFALNKDHTGPTEIRIHPDQIDRYSDDQWHHKTPPMGTLIETQQDRMRFCPVTMKYADGTTLQFKPGIRETVFHGEKGRLYLRRNDYRTDPIGLLPAPSKNEKSIWDGEGNVARPHLENWVQAMRTRSTPNAPVEVGHRSVTVCHLANLARHAGHDLTWDPTGERFTDVQDNAMLSRPRRSGFELPEA